MPGSSEFFGERSAQAVLKHGILTRYAHYFASRAGAATSGNVTFIDGYAGEGRYEDGNPGSPLLLASEAERVTMLGRNVSLALVEQDSTRRERLRRSLADEGVLPDLLIGDPFEEVALNLIDRYAGRAILLFVDPFGLAISFKMLIDILNRSGRGQPIDVLYHFSLSSMARMGRAAVSSSVVAAANANQIDLALGPTPWREAFLSTTDEEGSATIAAVAVAGEFARRVEDASGVRSVGIAVRQKPDQLARYLLMLFTRDRRARWDFADQAGKAHVDWLLHCDTADYLAFVRHEGGQESFFPVLAPTLQSVEEELGAMATNYLHRHLRDLLLTRGSIRPVDSITDTYGEMLGRARSLHIRAALKTLNSEGLTSDNAVGNFWEREIHLDESNSR